MKRLILLSLIAANFVRQPSLVVEIEQGLLRGRVSENGQFIEYLGIPYASTTPSTRFQAPLPPAKWNGVFDAINENTRCPQMVADTAVIGNEDCLKLNIYVPTNASAKKSLPVMFYIHGGGFFEGTGQYTLYGPDYIVRHGVILVSINYRLNILGFLCLGIKEAPGNAGLKDQIAALHWVHKNIAAFGGNPENITLFGESAGSASTSYHLLSPLSKGLFKRAILQSGSSLSSWAIQTHPIEQASAVARSLGYETKDPHKMYKLFMNTPFNELVSTKVQRLKGSTTLSEFMFVPCVEKDIPGLESFINNAPIDILNTGNYNKVPMIIGFNDREGIWFASKENDTTLKEMDVGQMLPSDLQFQSNNDREDFTNKVRQYYFENKNISRATILNLTDLYSDMYFKLPPIVESELIAKTSNQPLYNYLFQYNGIINMPKYISGFAGVTGASHADELFYLFKPYAFPLPHRFTEYAMINRVTTMWTNFAKYGNPTPRTTNLLPVKWMPSKGPDLSFLIIDKEFSMAPLPIDEAIQLWNQTYSRHRRRNFAFKN